MVQGRTNYLNWLKQEKKYMMQKKKRFKTRRTTCKQHITMKNKKVWTLISWRTKNLVVDTTWCNSSLHDLLYLILYFWGTEFGGICG